MRKECAKKDHQNEDCDSRRRDKDVRISPVQLLRDQEITTHEKQRVIIVIIINDEKEYWFGRLGDETVHVEDSFFEERF